MSEMTAEQRAAVDSRGKVIVSASAGSGKTFVMIEKLVKAVEEGADLDDVLAVTFTKKAAAQMKERLRSALISKLATSDDRERIKLQLSKISSADISTIHSLCARLLRTYFYRLGIDGGFEIISGDDSAERELTERALDELFDRLYEEENADFYYLLKRYSKKRSDASLRKLVLDGYSRVRTVARYGEMLSECENLYTQEGFDGIVSALDMVAAQKYGALYDAVVSFANSFNPASDGETYAAIFREMTDALSTAAEGGIFCTLPPLSTTPKPRKKSGVVGDEDERYKSFRADIAKKYAAVRGDICDYETERARFFESGRSAVAFSRLLMQFDGIYAKIKRDENKLDYNDLEHLTLQLLTDGEVKDEITSRFKYVFVDEYQDVNPVQEEIISAFGGESFLVGDVKQAIYGFRGSKSLFFAQKYERYEGGEGTALKLSDNFRSCKRVIDFVNALFSSAMTENTCGFDFKTTSLMRSGAPYPGDAGKAEIDIFGKDEREERQLGVYSVAADGRKITHTREGLAVLKAVEEELQSSRYDPKTGAYVPISVGDICILTRKNRGDSTDGIIRALTDAGYRVSGAHEGNLTDCPEVKTILDILSLIANSAQDIPLVSAMLSPLGDFSEDELARIRIKYKGGKQKLSFYQCCERYFNEWRDPLSRKLAAFYKILKELCDFSEVAYADELIDKILSYGGMEARLCSGDGSALSNVLALSSKAHLPLQDFLNRAATGLGAAAASPSGEGITVMSMHAAKGLEFPVVIIADVCRTFKGREFEELPFDDVYGFAPRSFDEDSMCVYPTLLRRLVKMRSDREELVNELNLFYVACTRAEYSLHIMAEGETDYSPADALGAKRYCDLFDMHSVEIRDFPPADEFSGITDRKIYISAPADPETFASINSRFERPYTLSSGIDLPVKSSASAILKSRGEEEPYFAEKQLFPQDAESYAERGTAYHRFLELCDFSIKDSGGIEEELQSYISRGEMSKEQCDLLDIGELKEILNMPVFSALADDKGEILREQEFLCMLSARDVLGADSDEKVLVQGAIDLLSLSGDKAVIIDYKYSSKSDEGLKESYSPQLALYKKAVSVIKKISESDVSAYIVNLRLRRVIAL